MRALLAWLFTITMCFGGPPVRVVSQTVGTDELLVSLAEPSQIAALSHLSREVAFSAVAKAALVYPQVHSRDAEGILTFKPTLVLVTSYTQPELLVQLQRSKVRLLRFDHFNTLEETYVNLRLLARELGAEAKAEALIAQCQSRLAQLTARLKGVQPVRVLAPSKYGFTAGRETTFQDLCDHAGAINVAGEAGLKGHLPTPADALLSWKVDCLVIAGDSAEAELAIFRKQLPYRYMDVVKRGRHVLLKPHELSCVTHLRIDIYESLARQLHPDRFP
jgi:iron complex transport system substrate-binding protein